ncbi:NUDIX hydrolase [Phytomonospora endophytica]|uniref:ADP-ribose pyrophosphatase YjhB (NUDIX family) n=1 Tax=Phytomonospora endophytica TaxID=714109 RepID=A0A841FTB0_9ACTN|nr:NUDIX domain-containing protein [Phytomonospora endophytica]MBB6035769.1 ADP-ribose pyrophosphatase YjhB (NUDIX family) [Phytomonospora endophytica]GIG69552.1 putative MutT/NUDIX-like protein [Phytomonospora endophytica]
MNGQRGHHAGPKANSLVPAVGAFVLDEAGALLLVKRRDGGRWALPGGAQEVGESVTAAVRREVAEETGLSVEITGIVGVYSDPHRVIEYPDGECRQEFSVVVRARVTGGVLRAGDDAVEARWCPALRVAALDVDPAMRRRIDHGLHRREPYLD